MNQIQVNSLTRLKICCSFSEFMEKEKLRTKLEKNLVEMLWTYLEQNSKICRECQ